jgi:hypothetical protein
MPLTLAQIPLHDEYPAGALPTGALRGVRLAPRRRTVLRAMTLGALTIGAVAADWAGRLLPTRRAQAALDQGPNGLQGWSANDCSDAYPYWGPNGVGYEQQSDNVGSYQYPPYLAACFGGNYRGSTYCSGAWHRSGSVISGGTVTTYTPINTCGDFSKLNAWRWTTPASGGIGTLVWRCSDGQATVTPGGYTYYTICRASLGPP